jgi:hypothetical protein
MRRITQWADIIEGNDKQYAPLARHLRSLADNFKTKAIIEFVEILIETSECNGKTVDNGGRSA